MCHTLHCLRRYAACGALSNPTNLSRFDTAGTASLKTSRQLATKPQWSTKAQKAKKSGAQDWALIASQQSRDVTPRPGYALKQVGRADTHPPLLQQTRCLLPCRCLAVHPRQAVQQLPPSSCACARGTPPQRAGGAWWHLWLSGLHNAHAHKCARCPAAHVMPRSALTHPRLRCECQCARSSSCSTLDRTPLATDTAHAPVDVDWELYGAACRCPKLCIEPHHGLSFFLLCFHR